MATKKDAPREDAAKSGGSDALREPAERLFAHEIEALLATDSHERPPGWKLSPRAVLTYVLGGKAGDVEISPKYVGAPRLVEIAIATLATDRALMLIGEPGTAKSWLSEHLAAAIAGDSQLLVQGTAGTTEEQIRYSWNYALLLAEGPSPRALVPSPVYRGLADGKLVRFEEITRCPSEVQDALITLLSEKVLAVPELGTHVQARRGFNIIATANTRDRGVNDMSAALKRRFNIVVLPVPTDIDTEVSIVQKRVREIGTSLKLPAAPPAQEAVRRIVTIFQELRRGQTTDGKQKIKIALRRPLDRRGHLGARQRHGARRPLRRRQGDRSRSRGRPAGRGGEGGLEGRGRLRRVPRERDEEARRRLGRSLQGLQRAGLGRDMASSKVSAKSPKAPGAAAKQAAPASGLLAKVFGVRHLSPMGAIHLQRYLAAVNPTAVLVEGPSDATENIVHLVDKKTKPPVAILSFTKERPVRSILFPLAEYSPEWVALTWALRNKRVARFIDLPAETFLAIERRDADKPEEEAPATDTQAYLRDPYEAIARLTGEPDHDTWWEKHFEHTTAEDAYRQAIFEFGAGLRTVDHESPRRRAETLLREAFMRRKIRDAIAEGHEPERIVVVCGAYHAPVLTAEEPAMTDPEIEDLPRVTTVQTLMPYSYYRLSAQSGYGAGNRAPGYFQALWEEAREGSAGLERLGIRFLAEVAGRLRRAGNVRSSAEVIEAVRLANAMAALGGDATAPTLRDLRDAAVTCLGQGDAASVTRWIDEIAVGDSLGKVPEGVLRTSIQDDFYRLVKDLRLEDYLKDKDQTIKGSTSKEWLDLREDRFAKSPDAAFRDRNRSIFLHRLAALGIGFAKEATSESDRSESTYKEVWKARWTPSCEIELVENALRGDSIEIAAIRKLDEELAEIGSVGAAAALARRAVACDLPDAMNAALRKVQALAVDDADFAGMAGAAVDLAQLARYKDVRRIDLTPLAPLVAQLFLRAVLMAPEAARCSEEAGKPIGKALADVQQVALLHEGDAAIDVSRWTRTLDSIADDELADAHVAGVACALLLERGEITDEVLDRRVAKRISPGADPGQGAGFFEGLATRNRYALLSRKTLWSAMSAFIESLDDDAFRRAVVALRRAFAAFEAGESRKIATIIAEVWGSGGAALMQAIETKVDDAELASLQSDLEGLEDLGI
ncbi:MAG: DUF5682 family protein [Minicystis sp.]